MDFFQRQTAPALSSYFDVGFWTRLIFQMSYAEPCIRHAMAAVGSLHQTRNYHAKIVPEDASIIIRGPDEIDEQFDVDSHVEEDPFALVQYNKAIGRLTVRMDGSASSVQVTLVACIMFVCVEYLRGDSHSSHKHLKAGMGVAMSSLAALGSKTAFMDSMQSLQDSTIGFLNRIEVLSMLSGCMPSWNPPVEMTMTIPDRFANVVEARDSLSNIANLLVRFLRSMRPRVYTQSILPADYVTREKLRSKLEAWHAALYDMLSAATLTLRDLEAIDILKLHEILVQNWIDRSVELSETASDKYIPEYERAVALAESIHRSSIQALRSSTQDHSSFAFELQTITPLLYVCKHCRHPQIRRRAIALLKQTRRREGLWDSEKAAALAERIMSIEEAGLTKLDGSELPPEHVRIWRSQTMSQIGTNPKRHRIVFYTRPHGVDGPSHTRTEEILLP